MAQDENTHFVRGIAAAFAEILRVAGPSEQTVRLYVIAACEGFELNYEDFVAANADKLDLEGLAAVMLVHPK